MIRLRNMTAAYLFKDNKVLMMKRNAGRAFAPGLWTPVGGHMEADEFRDPQRTILREICEETGIEEKKLTDIKLRYITLRKKGDEIRVQYIYFGAAQADVLKDCDEGELHWIEQSRLMELNMSVTNRSALEHYFTVGIHTDEVYAGGADVWDGNPGIRWAALREFETEY